MQNKKTAVIDTETNWDDKVMSVGVAIAETDTWKLTDKKYYIITPECSAGGMYSSVMEMPNITVDLKGRRSAVISDLINTLRSENIDSVFAYNANFDFKHMPELASFAWYDIMKLAAYKQYNHSIPECADCCGTGRLKRNYGVESIMHMLTDSCRYREVHNALCDAVDELKIMRLLGHDFDVYKIARIN